MDLLQSQHALIQSGLTDRRRTMVGPDELRAQLSTATEVEYSNYSALGITLAGSSNAVRVLVSDPTRRIGNVTLHASESGGVAYFENKESEGQLSGAFRTLGKDCVLAVMDAGKDYVSLPTVFLRSHEQFFYWGRGSTAVSLNIEMEGQGAITIIGDDALISSNVWLRNHDMHALVDLSTMGVINRKPGNMFLEAHVWLGQDALLLNCESVGFGSIVGAKSLVRKPVEPRTAVGGVPARVIRRDVSWGRLSYAISEAECLLLRSLAEACVTSAEAKGSYQ